MGYFVFGGGGGGTVTPPAYLFDEGLTLTGTTVDLDPAETQFVAGSELGGIYEIPPDGQQYVRQVLAGIPQWVPATISAGVWIGPNAPPLVPPAVTWASGQLWFRNDPDADLYIWYPDAGGVGSGAWVRAAQPLNAISTKVGAFIGPNPPVNPTTGDLWLRNDPDFDLYVLNLDGTWVRAAKPL